MDCVFSIHCVINCVLCKCGSTIKGLADTAITVRLQPGVEVKRWRMDVPQWEVQAGTGTSES